MSHHTQARRVAALENSTRGGSAQAGADAWRESVRAEIAWLWGTVRPRRFASMLGYFLDYDESEWPVWARRALLKRARLRRQFRGVLGRFAREGDPTYTSHRTYRPDAWPERATWTTDERAWLSSRFLRWDQITARRALAFLCLPSPPL